jgi:serine/threonine protein kinase
MSGASATSGSGRVVGRYILYDEIASGGMATIHIGRLLGEIGFTRPVAIKRLLPQFARDPEFVSMFLEEARLAARIRHPNVVPVLDVVSTEEELFLVMEFIQGETVTRLTRVSRQRARIVPMPIALAIAADLLQGLHAAHEATDETGRPLHIVHRDVSPHNVMVGNDGVARVLDFGIAKASSSSQSTRDGEVKGKFAYMSPEQLSSVPVDRRADVFAASIVLWEMLTGERLFQAPDPAAIVGRVLNGRIAPPSERAAGIPAQLDALVMKGLSRNVADRYETAKDMARAIDKLGVSIARPTDVGTWVNRIAGDTLKKRARRIAEIESTGSWSASNALAATASISNRPLPLENTGSGSGSRSGLRPKSEPSVPTAMPSPTPSAPPAGVSASQPLAAQSGSLDIDIDAPPRRSRVGRYVFLLLCALGSGAGVFVWRSGGIGPAREKLTRLLREPQPHGTSLGNASTASSTGQASVDTAGSAEVPNAIDITDEPGVMPKFHARMGARGGAAFHGRHGGAGHAVDPHVATQAPTAAAGGNGGDLGNELRNASGGGIGVGKDAITTTTARPTGDVPQRPSQGQVQAALMPVMRAAKTCFSPDSPATRATITFQSNGSVKSIAVSGFAAGKSQEGCVKEKLGRAHVDPFSDPTYSVPLTIRP